MVTIRFESELASFKGKLDQVSSVSLLMTASTALGNEGLFQLTPFVDTGRLVVIRGNYRETTL